MKKLNEYDLSYICYYAERIELSSISAGFDSQLSTQSLQILIQELKVTGKFHYYKKNYQDLLEKV